MPSIICTKCGKAVEVPKLQGDYSTFVCDECMDKINLPAYKAELAELEAKPEKTESENRRLEFLRVKIASIGE